MLSPYFKLFVKIDPVSRLKFRCPLGVTQAQMCQTTRVDASDAEEISLSLL